MAKSFSIITKSNHIKAFKLLIYVKRLNYKKAFRCNLLFDSAARQWLESSLEHCKEWPIPLSNPFEKLFASFLFIKIHFLLFYKIKHRCDFYHCLYLNISYSYIRNILLKTLIMIIYIGYHN